MDLRGKTVLISAGPMRSALDSVRYMQNRSSGKMGIALGHVAAAHGAQVVMLLGPVEKATSEGAAEFEVHRYEGPREYRAHLSEIFPRCDIFLSAAAVLDFEFVSLSHKMERASFVGKATLTLPIRPVEDMVATAAALRRPDQLVVAFAAESGTDDAILERAKAKLEKKQVQVIVANPVRPGLGPEAEENLVWVIGRSGKITRLGPMPKNLLAAPLWEQIFEANSSEK